MSHTPGFRTFARLLRKALELEDGAASGPRVTRRGFVKGLAAGAALGALPFTMEAFAAEGGTPPRIAVIGAGLAGLNAAWRLKQAGFTAQIFEASKRVGGRVMTTLAGADEGLVIDLGGEFINTTHKDMLALAKEFGIPLYNRKAEDARLGYPGVAFYFGGKLHGEEQVAKDLRPLAKQIARDAGLLNADFKKNAPALDRLSVAQYLDMHKDKIPAFHVRSLVENTIRTEYGVEPEYSSALQLLYNLPKSEGGKVDILGASDEMFTVAGGTQMITSALAKSLRGQIAVKKTMTAVRQEGAGYGLSFDDGSAASCDYLIFAVPFTALRYATLNVHMPDKLRRFIREANLGFNEKVVAGFKERVWRTKRVFGHEAWTNLGFSEVWDATQRQPGRQDGALTFFLGGADVQVAAGSSPEQAGARFTGFLDAFVPGAKAAATGQYLKTSWSTNELAYGAYSSFRPGQLTDFAEYFWTESQSVAAGNIAFAGEQLSQEHFGFMNGAAQTGRLAADFVLRSIKKG